MKHKTIKKPEVNNKRRRKRTTSTHYVVVAARRLLQTCSSVATNTRHSNTELQLQKKKRRPRKSCKYKKITTLRKLTHTLGARRGPYTTITRAGCNNKEERYGQTDNISRFGSFQSFVVVVIVVVVVVVFSSLIRRCSVAIQRLFFFVEAGSYLVLDRTRARTRRRNENEQEEWDEMETSETHDVTAPCVCTGGLFRPLRFQPQNENEQQQQQQQQQDGPTRSSAPRRRNKKANEATEARAKVHRPPVT